MLIIPPPQFRPRREPRQRRAPMLVLEAAWVNLDDNPRFLWLRFDRAVDIACYSGAAITLFDGGENGERLLGDGGASLDDPRTVRIVLDPVGPWPEGDTVLAATAGSGIVAAGDGGQGGTWAGVGGVLIPFP